MKRILAGFFSLLLISCAAHVDPKPDVVAEKEPDLQQQFCAMAENQMTINESAAAARAAEDGMRLQMSITKCDLLSDSAGRIYYTVNTWIGDQPIFTIDAISIIVRVENGWTIAKDSPLYVIDHVRGDFKWFVKDQVNDEGRGQEI